MSPEGFRIFMVLAVSLIVGLLTAILVEVANAATTKKGDDKLTVTATRYNANKLRLTVWIDVNVKHASRATIWADGTEWNAAGPRSAIQRVRLEPGRNRKGYRVTVTRLRYQAPGFGAGLHPFYQRLLPGRTDGAVVGLRFGSGERFSGVEVTP
jgi:hypothetical protein